MTHSEIYSAISGILAARPLYGAAFVLQDYESFSRAIAAEVLGYTLFSFRWEQGWGIEATIDLRLAIKKEIRGNRERSILCTNVIINSPSTARSIPQTVAFAALLRDVAEIAALIESAIDGAEIVASHA